MHSACPEIEYWFISLMDGRMDETLGCDEGSQGVSSMSVLMTALRVVSTRVKHLRFLVSDDDEVEKSVPELPRLSDKQWCRLLNASCFTSQIEGLPCQEHVEPLVSPTSTWNRDCRRICCWQRRDLEDCLKAL